MNEVGFFKVHSGDGTVWGYTKWSMVEKRCEQLKENNISFRVERITLDCPRELLIKKPKKQKAPKIKDPAIYKIQLIDTEEDYTDWFSVQVRMQTLRDQFIPYRVYKWNADKGDWGTIKKYCFKVRAN